MIYKSIDSLTTADIESLINNQVLEDKHIEYKREIPGASDGQKLKFLQTFSSFANTDGGYLIYGISEKAGKPLEANGVSGDIDSIKLRLENMVRESIEPRIMGYQIRTLGEYAEGPLLVIHVPKSWSPPHMIKPSGVFYARNNSQKYRMDIGEIRNAFLSSSGVADKIRNFRAERVMDIINNQGHMALEEGPRFVLHIVPLMSVTSPVAIDISSLSRNSDLGRSLLLGGTGFTLPNLDGLIGIEHVPEPFKLNQYCQLYRSGIIEIVLVSHQPKPNHSGDRWIHPHDEKRLIEGLLSELRLLNKLNIACPMILMISLVQVRGANINLEWFITHALSYALSGTSHTYRKETAILPEVVVDDYGDCSDFDSAAKLLKPVFDALWNAFGLPRSLNYDESGCWNHALYE